jgi:hypothetical protein
MKTMILAAVAALSLGVGSAYAQGAPAGFANGTDYQGPGPGPGPAYGAQAFADHRHEASLLFLGPNTVLGKMFRYNSNSDRVAATATSAKGG